MTTFDLTDRQLAVLSFVADYVDEHGYGYGPSQRDISSACGFTLGASTQRVVRQLAQAKLVAFTPDIARSTALRRRAGASCAGRRWGRREQRVVRLRTWAGGYPPR